MPFECNHIVFITSASKQIGLGHFYRCINFSKFLKRYNFDNHFYLSHFDSQFEHLIQQLKISYTLISSIKDLSNLSNKIIVLDGYNYTDNDFNMLKSNHNYLIYIDDYCHQFSNFDIVISPGPQFLNQDFKHSKAKLFIGPQFSLINPHFYNKNYKFSKKVSDIFLCFGGSDPYNLTLFTLETLSSMPYNFHIALGPYYTFHHSLITFSGKRNIHIYKDINQYYLSKVMANCQVAIVPGSTLSLELCAVGVSTLLLSYSDNQKLPSIKFHEKNMATFIGMYNNVNKSILKNNFLNFCNNHSLRQAVFTSNKQLFKSNPLSLIVKTLINMIE